MKCKNNKPYVIHLPASICDAKNRICKVLCIYEASMTQTKTYNALYWKNFHLPSCTTRLLSIATT